MNDFLTFLNDVDGLSQWEYKVWQLDGELWANQIDIENNVEFLLKQEYNNERKEKEDITTSIITTELPYSGLLTFMFDDTLEVVVTTCATCAHRNTVFLPPMNDTHHSQTQSLMHTSDYTSSGHR